MRAWLVGLWVGLSVVTAVGVASACRICSEDMTCMFSQRGAMLCLGDGMYNCTLWGRCFGPKMINDDGVIGITLIEDAGSPVGGIARVAPLAGEASVGRGGAHVAQRALGLGSGPRTVLYSATGFFDSGTAEFKTPQGDGFTLRRENQGRGALFTVCALSGGLQGRLLARERIGEDEALVVRVPFQGRTRVLVVTAANLPRAEAEARQVAAVSELRAGAAVQPQADRPPFELRLLDR